AMLTDPGNFGLTKVTAPACPGCGIGVPAPDAGDTLVPNPDEYLWWDFIHMTRTAHEVIGEAAADFVTAGRASPSLAPPASPVAPGKEGNLLIMKQVAPRFPEAAIGWQGAGVDTSGLGSLQIRSTSPGGATHGLASNPMIWPEVKAVGWDWSADET